MSELFDPYHKWLGIPPSEQPPNHYRLLGVALLESDADVIEGAADQRMAHLRTFQSPQRAALAAKLLNEVAAAKICLLCPEKRARYDCALRGRSESPADLPIRPTAPTIRSASVSSRTTKKNARSWLIPVVIGTLSVLIVCMLVYLASRDVAPVAVQRPAKTNIHRTPSRVAGKKNDYEVEKTTERRWDESHHQEPGIRTEKGTDADRVAQETHQEEHEGERPTYGRDEHDAERLAFSRAEDESGKSQPGSDVIVNANSEETDWTDVVERVEPAVVRIETDKIDRVGLGSGFIVDSSGLIVTNYHVIEGARTAKAIFKNEHFVEIEGYVAVDKGKDLALLRVKTKEKLPMIPISPSLPRKGESVAAFGSPHGLSGTVSQGIVSAVRSGKEVRKILGAGAYDSMGRDSKMTWVQTTAAISGGNSGGPLVDMKGRVVGVNSWTRLHGQNLNFAVAATEIKQLLQKAGDNCRDLASLPKPRTQRQARPSLGGRKKPPIAESSSFGEIRLPSGNMFSEIVLEIPDDWQRKLFPDGAFFHIMKYPSGNARGAYSFNEDGKLHGVAASLYPNGRVQVMACYYKAKLDGPLRLWEENSSRLFYAEYTRGNKNGFVCLFRNSLPWLIQEWNKGQFSREYLISCEDGSPTAMSIATLAGDNLQSYASAKELLHKLEAEIEAGKAETKKGLRKWYRQVDEQLRRARASGLNAQRRQAMLDRIHERDAQERAVFQRKLGNAWRGRPSL